MLEFIYGKEEDGELVFSRQDSDQEAQSDATEETGSIYVLEHMMDSEDLGNLENLTVMARRMNLSGVLPFNVSSEGMTPSIEIAQKSSVNGRSRALGIRHRSTLTVSTTPQRGFNDPHATQF